MNKLNALVNNRAALVKNQRIEACLESDLVERGIIEHVQRQ